MLTNVRKWLISDKMIFCVIYLHFSLVNTIKLHFTSYHNLTHPLHQHISLRSIKGSNLRNVSDNHNFNEISSKQPNVTPTKRYQACPNIRQAMWFIYHLQIVYSYIQFDGTYVKEQCHFHYFVRLSWFVHFSTKYFQTEDVLFAPSTFILSPCGTKNGHSICQRAWYWSC